MVRIIKSANKMSRRFLVGALGACSLPALAATGAAADLILTNARIYTVEAAHPWAQSVAIKDGRILAVGSAADIARRKGAATRVVDLGGKLVLPAFGDAHVHPVFGGMSYSRCALQAGKSLADYSRIISACVAAEPGTGVIYGVGWEDALFPPNGIPRKDLLDAISKDRPMIFMSIGGHSLWVNSKVLALAGITKTTADPTNGHIDRDPATGEAVGGLQEAAMDLVKAYIPAPTVTDMQNSIIYLAKYFNSVGITDWHDAGVEFAADGSSPTIDAYAAVRDGGKLTSHVSIALKWQNEHALEQIPALMKASAHAKALGLSANAVKFYLDGVIPQKTAAMLEPYENSGMEKGTSQIRETLLKQAVTEMDARGMQVHFHAIGDGAVREALDAVQAAQEHNGVRDNRPMMSHLNVVEPADQVRFGKLHVVAVLQPLWAGEYPYMRIMEQTIGPKRSGYIYPGNSILKAGGMLAYGADWPVASANPLEGIEVAVTRTTPGGPDLQPLLPAEGVTLAQAVAAYTINVAYVNHLDKETGSIAVGKSADLIVLDRNIFEIAPTQISRTKVMTTLFKGREVYGTLP